jgi:isoquinoline 1-oxidoreductase beta subunit
MPTAWLQRSTFPPILSYNNREAYGSGGEMSMGWNDVPFDIPNMRAENGPAEAQVRIGWFRSVANIYHAYAVHSFIDELAAAANRDRVEYLLAALGAPRVIELRPAAQQNRPNPYPLDTARTRRVVELVAEHSGWAKKKSTKNHGFGIAVHRSFRSYVSTVVEVQVDAAGKIAIPNVWTVADCGMIVTSMIDSIS